MENVDLIVAHERAFMPLDIPRFTAIVRIATLSYQGPSERASRILENS